MDECRRRGHGAQALEAEVMSHEMRSRKLEADQSARRGKLEGSRRG